MKLFVSYSHKDRKLVEDLVADLKAPGTHSVWYDTELSGGREWWPDILEKIQKCKVFIFALTPNSLASAACRKELKYAIALNRHILPVQLMDLPAGTLIPDTLELLQIVPYQQRGKRGSKEQALALVGALSRLSKAKRLPNPLPERPTPPIKFNVNEYLPMINNPPDDLDDQMVLVTHLAEFLTDGDREAAEHNEVWDRLHTLVSRDDVLRSRTTIEILRLLTEFPRR